nr:MAG TPA: DNA gyrase subunit A [Caudoviricetes sp.]
MSATTAGCGSSVGMNLKGVEIMNRVIFYKTATCPHCGKVATFDMTTKWKAVCRCGVLEPGNEVKAIIVKEVAK